MRLVQKHLLQPLCALSGLLLMVHAVSGAAPMLVAQFGGNANGSESGVILDPAGNMYGTTVVGGANNVGSVFKVSPDGMVSTIASFNTANGANPNGRLAIDAFGNLYGTTYAGGAGSHGTVFKAGLSGQLTTLASFDQTNGSEPLGGIYRDGVGNLFGTTTAGGPSGAGTIFKVSPAGTLTSMRLDLIGASLPRASVVPGPDGALYASTLRNKVVRIAPDGTLTGINATSSYGDVAIDRNGKIFLTFPFDGTAGSIFKVQPSGGFTTLASFDYTTTGAHPYAGALIDGAGNLYGTTREGGPADAGTVYKMTPEGVITVLATFEAFPGRVPLAGLTADAAGNLYGTTREGGLGGGTIFKVTGTGFVVVPEPAMLSALTIAIGVASRRQPRSRLVPTAS